ncbi:hypothetical protein G3I60_04350 [Streptomyces sp. SID13666]|uniref:hypothetical protein n=1 Tax=unclassified Streptomyces TaxID=2593676 RepID=UPI0013BFEF8F|nr:MULTISPECIES: hypothetical protein [unclassified Streptomyces]NEA53412.1 hypothetical protein [Streptomyces sp. SID13666]NEA69263.1 hypothetical protein [Streptomyces sp. SID13588]
MTSAGTGRARANRRWGDLCGFFGVFFVLWGLSWVHANVINGKLANHCDDLHAASFPFENSCTREDGTVEGANSVIFEGIFFVSLAAAVVSVGAVVMAETGRRK